MSQENLPLAINIQTDANNATITNIDIKGDLSFGTVPFAYEQTRNSFGEGQHIQFDLNNVQRADSAAMALVLEWHRLAKEQKAKISLLNVPLILKNIACVTELEELL